MKLCRDCAHHRATDQDSVRANVWYNHTCRARVSDFDFNPVTGERKVRYAYCRDVNLNGDCPTFEVGQIVALRELAK